MQKKKTNKNKSIGSLSATAQMTLHSVETVKLWHPAQNDKTPSVNHFFGQVGKFEVAAQQDDPYADFALLEIEQSMNEAFALFENIQSTLPSLQTSRIQYQEAVSKKPFIKSLRLYSRFGWRMAHLLEVFDILMVKLTDLQFKTLISRSQFESYRRQSIKAMRTIFNTSTSFYLSGINRDDVMAGNAKAIAAQEKYGSLPFEVVEGLQRAEFAPQIRTKKQ